MRLVPLADVVPGTTLGQPIYGPGGRLLLGEGVRLTSEYLAKLRARGMAALYVDDPDLSDVAPPEPIRAEARAEIASGLQSSFGEVARSIGGLLSDGDAGLASALAPAACSPERAVEAMEQVVASSPETAAAVRQAVGTVDAILQETAGQQVAGGLSNLRSHDAYTFDHSLDVTAVGLVLARAAGWNARQLRHFAVGLLLHDIGKLFVDPQILNKPARLSDAESARMRAHPLLGYALVKATVPDLGPLPAQVALQHHERQDGHGYPRRLIGTNTLGVREPNRIHDFGSVAAVADVYDALACDRPYRAALPGDQVHRMIERMSGTHLNAEAVRLFVATVPPFPVCSDVRLRGGEWGGHAATVVRLNRHDLARPVVRVLSDADGRRIDAVEVDLAAAPEVDVTAAASPTPARAAA